MDAEWQLVQRALRLDLRHRTVHVDGGHGTSFDGLAIALMPRLAEAPRHRTRPRVLLPDIGIVPGPRDAVLAEITAASR